MLRVQYHKMSKSVRFKFYLLKNSFRGYEFIVVFPPLPSHGVTSISSSRISLFVGTESNWNFHANRKVIPGLALFVFNLMLLWYVENKVI